MSSVLERYKKRLAGNATSVSEARKNQIMQTNNIAFEYSVSYKKGKIMDKTIPDNNLFEWNDYDFQIKHALTETEKKVIARPGTDITIGSYITYKSNGDRDVTMIIGGRLLDDEIMPSYQAYVCQDKLRLKGCPYEFPVYGFNSTYSSKGIVDSDQLYTVDSRNKIYVQRNKFTIRLFEYHRRYRIILGNKETLYRYFITEMDDISYPGMFIISLKIDEKHPNDTEFYAYNEEEIDFSDLLATTDSTPAEDVPMTIECANYYKVGDFIKLKSNKAIAKYSINSSEISVTEENCLQVEVPCEQAGLLVIKVYDIHGNVAVKNVIIK